MGLAAFGQHGGDGGEVEELDGGFATPEGARGMLPTRMTDQLTRPGATMPGMPEPLPPAVSAADPDGGLPRWTWVVVVTAVVAGFALRLHTGSALWLDEALTVTIARVPLGELADALRHDGAPPLYYVLLNLWMSVFGEGDVAVRAMSTVFAVATIPLVFVAGRRIGGQRAALFALALFASSPFAIRYATEARMYSLVVLLTVAGLLLVERAVRRTTPVRLAAAGVVAGALVLTHYWSAFLIAATVVALLWRRRFRVAVAVGGGAALALLPWLPVLLYQLEHTGAPWAPPPGLQVTVDAIVDFAGGYNKTGSGVFLGLLLMGLSLLGIWGHPVAPGAVQLRWPADRRTGTVALIGVGGLVLGVVASVIAGSGFASRYAAITLVLFLLVAAVGIGRLPSARAQSITLTVCVVLGLIGGAMAVHAPRTQARTVADALRAHAAPGDVIAYCPDQLGPAVSRLLSPSVDQVTYPSYGRPEVVDWVDYAERNKDGVPERFAYDMLERAGGDNAVWLVAASGYRTFGTACTVMAETLERERSAVRYVNRRARYFERMTLERYAAP
jgi:hypothetical protein